MMMAVKRKINSLEWELKVRTKVAIEQINPKDKTSTENGEGTDIEARVEVEVGIGDATGTAKDPGVMIDNTDIVIAHVQDIGRGTGQETAMTGDNEITRNVLEVPTGMCTAEVIARVHGHPGQAETHVEKTVDTHDRKILWSGADTHITPNPLGIAVISGSVPWFAKPV
jgi:hypothetical protein